GTYVELAQITRLRGELLVGLHHHAISPVVEVKVVYVQRAHINLEGGSDLRKRNVQALGLLALDRHQVLGIAGDIGAEHTCELLALAGRANELVEYGLQLLGCADSGMLRADINGVEVSIDE